MENEVWFLALMGLFWTVGMCALVYVFCWALHGLIGCDKKRCRNCGKGEEYEARKRKER